MTRSDRLALDPLSMVGRCATAICAKIDGDVVALNIDRGVCYGLDPIGSGLWDMIERPATILSLCADLEDRYRVDSATCARDVTAWLAEMCDEGLVTVSSPRTATKSRD